MSASSVNPESADTIAAISTPPGRGGIGIVRLSGPQATSIAAQLVHLHHPLEPARARLADVLDDSESTTEAGRIDEAIVTFFAAPNSYTTEDVVEIAAHASPVVLDLLLRRAISLGARLAEPGEFTQRAFLAGRLDLTQAEAVRDLIDAQTLTQARQAASQMGGALSRRVAPIKQSLVELIALLEAGIDFAEDDVDVTPQSEIATRIGALTPPLAALEASFARGRIVHDGLTLAIVGRPNVGKSSLFNRLVERDRAIVTATPGTTRDLVTEHISLAGIPLELVDTAGLREAPRGYLEEAEQIGIRRTREALADAALILIVLDATQPLNDEERSLLAAVENRPALIAINKCDLVVRHEEGSTTSEQCSGTAEELPRAGTKCQGTTAEAAEKLGFVSGHELTRAVNAAKSMRLLGPEGWSSGKLAGLSTFSATSSVVPQSGHQESRALALEGASCSTSPEFANLPALQTSALTGEGIQTLRDHILALATGGAAPEPGLLTNLRQHQAISTTLAALADADKANAASIPHEMILLDLYRALWALDSLTGQTTPDDILNLIFSTFCIGK